MQIKEAENIMKLKNNSIQKPCEISVFDVAAYILSKLGKTTTMKLQKLVYYSQAWSLVWDDRPLFSEEIQAWANGPVCPALYSAHRHQFEIINISGGNLDNLDDIAKETIDSVLKYYGDKSSQWLRDLTHMEDPWMQARGNTPDGDICQNCIDLASMAEYYSSLPKDEQSV
jgi:uncharacterized phage-associated protein